MILSLGASGWKKGKSLFHILYDKSLKLSLILGTKAVDCSFTWASFHNFANAYTYLKIAAKKPRNF